MFQGCVTSTAEIPPSYTSTKSTNILVEHNKRNGTITYQTRYNLTNVLHLGYSEAKLYAIETDNLLQIRLKLEERSLNYNKYNTVNIANRLGYDDNRNIIKSNGLNLTVYSEDISSTYGEVQVVMIDIPLSINEIQKLKKILELDNAVIITITDNGQIPTSNTLDAGEKKAMLEMIRFVESK